MVSANGRFVYTSNRDTGRGTGRIRSSIAVFRVHESMEGSLTLVQHASCGGSHPRHFVFLDEGRTLLIANTFSDTVACFHVDPATGLIDEASLSLTVSPFLREPTFLLPLARPAAASTGTADRDERKKKYWFK